MTELILVCLLCFLDFIALSLQEKNQGRKDFRYVLCAQRGTGGQESACQCRKHNETRDPWVGKSPWRRAWQPTPVFLPGESHGQRSLEGYSPRGHKELDTTEVTLHACTCSSEVLEWDWSPPLDHSSVVSPQALACFWMSQLKVSYLQFTPLSYLL